MGNKKEGDKGVKQKFWGGQKGDKGIIKLGEKGLIVQRGDKKRGDKGVTKKW
jgi:hypothetical protein